MVTDNQSDSQKKKKKSTKHSWDPTSPLKPTRLLSDGIISTKEDSKMEETSLFPKDDEGVDIPVFLQPMFGIDFVPYLVNDVSKLRKSAEEALSENKLNEIPAVDNVQIEALITSVNEKEETKPPSLVKRVTPGLLNRVKGRLKKAKSDKKVEVTTPEMKTEDDFKGVSYVRSESGMEDSETNSILADSSDDDDDYYEISKALSTRQSLMKAGVIHNSRRDLVGNDAGFENHDEIEFDALIKSVNEKKKIKAGLLRRVRNRRKKQVKSPNAAVSATPKGQKNKFFDDDMKLLDLARSGSDLSNYNSLYESASSLPTEIPDNQDARTNAFSSQSSQGQLSPHAEALENGGHKINTDVVALDQSSHEKKKKKKGLLKRIKGRKSPTPKGSDKKLKEERRLSGVSSEASTNKSRATSASDISVDWFKSQQTVLQNHHIGLQNVHAQVQVMQDRSIEINKRVSSVQDEVVLLQRALEKAEQQLRRNLDDFDATQTELARLEQIALKASESVLQSIRQIQDATLVGARNIPTTPPRTRGAATDPIAAIPKKLLQSDSFMRVHDMEIERRSSLNDVVGAASTSSMTSSDNEVATTTDFVFVDHNINAILTSLSTLGHRYVTDESERFVPTRGTERLLAKYKKNPESYTTSSLPMDPWNVPHGEDVLVWMGDIGHTGFGSNWPVCKARGLIKTSPRDLVEFMLDSSRVKEYNKMSQGRDDLFVFQDSLDITAEESSHGYAGACKILRSRNKPKLLPRAIEITSLLYAKPVEHIPGAYLIVNRSVFDDDSGTLKTTSDTITSEMLLGVNLVRPVDDTHQVSEFTSITHIYPPGVPERLARTVAPNSALNMIKDIQKVFN